MIKELKPFFKKTLAKEKKALLEGLRMEEIPLNLEELDKEAKKLMEEIYKEPYRTPEFLRERRYGHNLLVQEQNKKIDKLIKGT